MAIDPARVRSHFPSLHIRDDGHDRIYLDNPGGTQVAQPVIDRTVQYLRYYNANHGGAFHTSVESDSIVDGAHNAMAAFLNASSGDEIIFGQNMTSLTFAMSRSIGRTLQPGDEIIVTKMDHDANISPWLLLAEDLGLSIRWLDFDPDTFRYDLHGFTKILSDRTRVLAVNYASNAIGTINDVRSLSEQAHSAGALVYVDSVQFTPHAPTDVQFLGCDFLACSPYKFFGPHQGILWGRRDLLEELSPYKVRAASDALPSRFETGTLSREGLAGTLGAIEYLEWLGSEMASEHIPEFGHLPTRTRYLHAAMREVQLYERALSERMIEGLLSIDGLRIYGLSNPSDLDDRVPTFSFTLSGQSPRSIAEKLAAKNIFTWDGHYYAVEVIQRLGLASTGGMLRVGLAHYNTIEEIDRLIEVLGALE